MAFQRDIVLQALDQRQVLINSHDYGPYEFRVGPGVEQETRDRIGVFSDVVRVTIDPSLGPTETVITSIAGSA